jgi:hypothetical protein
MRRNGSLWRNREKGWKSVMGTLLSVRIITNDRQYGWAAIEAGRGDKVLTSIRITFLHPFRWVHTSEHHVAMRFGNT